jgi:hypothetical protein
MLSFDLRLMTEANYNSVHFSKDENIMEMNEDKVDDRQVLLSLL